METATRNPDGTFPKGVSGNPKGRPRATAERRRGILDTLLTDTAWAAIIETAIKQAIEGDDKARAWISKYVLPEPRPDESAPIDSIDNYSIDLSSLSEDDRKALQELSHE